MNIIRHSPDEDIETLITRIYSKKDKSICCYCGVRLTSRNRTKDHFIPLSKGGQDWSSNIYYSCKGCNRKKSNLMPHEFLARMELKVAHLAPKMPFSKLVYEYYCKVVNNVKRLIENF